jgi:isoleucyl-tRNA synthetase
MGLARKVAALGHAARNLAGVKVRQPLREMLVSGPRAVSLRPEIVALIQDELNVKRVRPVELEGLRGELFTPRVAPRMSALGPKFGPLAPKIAAALSEIEPQEVAAKLHGERRLKLTIAGQAFELGPEEVELSWELREGWKLAVEGDLTAIICTEIDEELRREGFVRELIHQVQLLRKEAGFEVTDRIALYYEAGSELAAAIASYDERIKSEVLATSLAPGLPARVDYRAEREVNGQRALLGLVRQRR